MPSLYLASASPRRRELLTQIGVPLSVLATAIDESPLPNEAPAAYVERLARGKAAAGLAMLEGRGEGGCVLGADTSVVIDGRILGKPVDQAEGLAMLATLSGREHQVLTAVALAATGGVEARVVECRVRFRQVAWKKRCATGRAASRRTKRADMRSRASGRYSSAASKAVTVRWSGCLCVKLRNC